MKNRGIARRLMVVILATPLAAATAGADDPKKPAAIAASSTTSGSKASTASAKPAAVQASTAKASTKGSTDKPLTLATHLYVVDATVPLRVKTTADGRDYKIATKLHEVDLTVRGHGTEAKFGTTITTEGKQEKQPEYEGLTAFQILVEQKYFEYVDGVGFVPTKEFARFADISVSSGSGGESKVEDKDKNKKKRAFLGAEGEPDIGPGQRKTAEQEKMVDPNNTESVAEDPSQQGGLFGYGYDGPIDNYDTSDPNTPEGKKEILRNRLSKLSRQCYATSESTEYWSCRENCSNLLFSEYGKISQDRVNECQRECKGVFEQKKPQVCREADGVQAQLEQLGDER